VNRTGIIATVCALGLLASCRTAVSPPVIDPAMASCVPEGSIVLAGLDLEQLRALPLYPKLPKAALALMEPFGEARSLLAASSGKDLVVVARGPFRAAPAGTKLIAPGLAVAGSAESVRGASGAPDLVAQAESVAGGKQIWIVVRGDVTLPLTGNAANVNRLLRNMEFAALTVRIESTVEFAIAARGRTRDAARHFEDTLRATLTVAAAAEAKQSGLAALLRSIRIRREDRMVHAGLSTDTETARKLLELISP
jgi:hypothetical protein